MKRIVIIFILLIFAVSIFFMVVKAPINTVNPPALSKQEDVNELKPINQSLKHLHSDSEHSDHNHSKHRFTAHPVDEKLTASNPSDHSEDDNHVHSSETVNNSAAQFDKLPKAMQKEIKQLSGRDNPNIQPVEVEPGVFLIPAGKGVNVVPVAVINEDGTLSIHEY